MSTIKKEPRLLVSIVAFQLLICVPGFAQNTAPIFTPVQPETFDGNMALSNAWGDYDNDGDLDLAISFKTGDVRLYQNNDGQFNNIGPQLGLPTGGKETRSIGWGDYNKDGYLDLYVGSNRNGNELYMNKQAEKFVEVGVELGIDIPHVSTRQISWVDYDNNGTVDLFVADRIGANYLFRNDDGVFVDVSGQTKLDDVRPTVGACWFDYNQDGLLDLFLANQAGSKDALYRNDGATFTDVAASLGVGGTERSSKQGGVDCTVGDFNNDGHFDLFVANYGTNYLYKNEGKDGFSEVSEQMGITGDDLMVGASWADYDNDGLLDLYVAGYHDIDGERSPVDRLFHNDGDKFNEIITQGTSLSGADHGVQWADFDGDGDLDISLTEGYNIAGHHPVLRNELAMITDNRSLQIEVLDKDGHSTSAGAEVRLYNDTGKLLATRLVTTGDGYNSHSNQAVHFGVGTNEKITVEVTFMTVTGREKQRINNIDPKQWMGRILKIQKDS